MHIFLHQRTLKHKTNFTAHNGPALFLFHRNDMHVIFITHWGHVLILMAPWQEQVYGFIFVVIFSFSNVINFFDRNGTHL